jgi:hypothetical protein
MERKGPWPCPSLTVPPADPILAAGTRLVGVEQYLDPLDFCTRPVFVWAPTYAFAREFGNSSLPCPQCGKADHVHRKGWAPPVKVIDIDGWFTLVSRRCVWWLIPQVPLHAEV